MGRPLVEYPIFEAGQAKIIGRLDVLEADVKIIKDDVDYLKFYADEIYRDVTINAGRLAVCPIINTARVKVNNRP